MKDECKYNSDIVENIKLIYIIAIISWIILIFILKIYNSDAIGWLFLILPVIVFTINFSNLDGCTETTEKEMFGKDFLSFSFITATLLIDWNKDKDKTKSFKLLVVAVILLILSSIDLWLPKDKLTINKHIRSIFQTSALALLSFTLYTYCKEFCIKTS